MKKQKSNPSRANIAKKIEYAARDDIKISRLKPRAGRKAQAP